MDLEKWAFSIVAATLVCWLVLLRLRKGNRHQGKKQPPGPWALPLVGNLGISNNGSLYQRCVEWTKVYGNIFRIKVGVTNVVVLYDAKTVKEFLAMEESLIRPHETIFYQICRGYMGLNTLNGKAWKDNRRFCMRVLRDLGFGKWTAEEQIRQQMRSLLNKIGDAQASTLPLADYLFTISFDIISAILFGTTFKLSDRKHEELEQHLVRTLQGFRIGSFVDSKPVWLSTVMSYVPYTRMAGMRSSMRVLREFIRERVKENQDTLEEGTARNFIDGYLKQMKEHKNDPNTHFRECHLLGCALDFFLGGVATPPYAAHWILLICAENPDTVQSRIHAEIDRTVGRNRQPAWKDRLEMPFTTASMWEMLRWRTESSLGMPRGVKEDIILGGFIIPKGTVVLPNTRGIKHNPDLWKRPDDFDPTRFLTPDGTELIKKPEYYLPFSFGKRMCPAESLANVQIFLYTTCLLQKYSVHPEESRQLPCLDPLVTSGHQADNQKLRFVHRE